MGVKPKFYAYILLLLTLLLLILPFLFSNNTTFENVLLTFIYLILVISFPIKYAIWNVWGKEILILNKKSISYQYNFGFVSNNLKTIPFKNIKISFQDFLMEKEENFGKIYFYEDDEKTDLPNLIHSTSVCISNENFEKILSEIEEIYRFDTFSMN